MSEHNDGSQNRIVEGDDVHGHRLAMDSETEGVAALQDVQGHRIGAGAFCDDDEEDDVEAHVQPRGDFDGPSHIQGRRDLDIER